MPSPQWYRRATEEEQRSSEDIDQQRSTEVKSVEVTSTTENSSGAIWNVDQIMGRANKFSRNKSRSSKALYVGLNDGLVVKMADVVTTSAPEVTEEIK